MLQFFSTESNFITHSLSDNQTDCGSKKKEQGGQVVEEDRGGFKHLTTQN